MTSRRSLPDSEAEEEEDELIINVDLHRGISETENVVTPGLRKGLIAVENERYILSVYIPSFILLDGLLIPVDLPNGIASDMIFLLLIVLSIVQDTNTAPKVVPIAHLQKKAFHLGKLICWLSFLMFVCVCVSDQFWCAVDVEIENDMTDNSTSEGEVEMKPFQVWEWSYSGFISKRDWSTSPQLEEKIYEAITSNSNVTSQGMLGTFHRYVSGLLKEIDPIGIQLIFHMLTGATKIIIARLLIIEAELTVKMLIKFYTTL